jgi:heme/copper-type cytochrome/quinol oxidase subunit 1
MIFYFVMPALMGFIANYFIPVIVNKSDMTFPRVNNIAFWILPPSIGLLVTSMSINQGTNAGWTLYPPLTTITYTNTISTDIINNYHYALAGISSILGAVNIITTAIKATRTLLGTSITITSVLIIISNTSICISDNNVNNG